MPYATSGGAKVWYDVAGSGDALVLTGGYGLMHNQYDFITPVLARDFRVVNWNHRGTGRSDRNWPRPFTLDDWIDDLYAVLDAAKVDRAYMMGLSYGGLFCIRAAARTPERIAKLVVSPGFASQAGPRLNRMQETILGIVETLGLDGFAVLIQCMDGADENQMGGKVAEQQRFIAEALRGNVTPVMLAKMMAVYNQVDLSGDLAALRQPVALLVGESGRSGANNAPVRASIDHFRSVCRHAELITVPGAGNTFTVVEKPEETAAKIREFLRRA